MNLDYSKSNNNSIVSLFVSEIVNYSIQKGQSNKQNRLSNNELNKQVKSESKNLPLYSVLILGEYQTDPSIPLSKGKKIQKSSNSHLKRLCVCTLSRSKEFSFPSTLSKTEKNDLIILFKKYNMGLSSCFPIDKETEISYVSQLDNPRKKDRYSVQINSFGNNLIIQFSNKDTSHQYIKLLTRLVRIISQESINDEKLDGKFWNDYFVNLSVVTDLKSAMKENGEEEEKNTRLENAINAFRTLSIHGWLEDELEKKRSEYNYLKDLHLRIISWNMQGQIPTMDSIDAILLDTDDRGSLPPSDILVFGFQEMDVSADSYLYDEGSGRVKLWTQVIDERLSHYNPKYCQIKSKLYVGLFILLYVKEELCNCIDSLEVDAIGVGMLGLLGNKGAIGLRFCVDGNVFTFVNCHLAAHDRQLERRNWNYREICKRLWLPFADSQFKKNSESKTRNSFDLVVKEMQIAKRNSIMSQNAESKQLEFSKISSDGPRNTNIEKESMNIIPSSSSSSSVLNSSSSSESSSLSASSSTSSDEGELSVFLTDYLFWFGDLNYRLSFPRITFDSNSNPSIAQAKDLELILNLIHQRDFDKLLAYDQLRSQICTKAAFENFLEGPINFPPTFKYSPGSFGKDKYDLRRVPSYTDRILYLPSDDPKKEVQILRYDSCQNINMSDHKPIFCHFLLPRISMINHQKLEEVRKELLKKLDNVENQLLPSQQLILPEENLVNGILFIQGKVGEERSIDINILNNGIVPLTCTVDLADLPDIYMNGDWIEFQKTPIHIEVNRKYSLKLNIRFTLSLLSSVTLNTSDCDSTSILGYLDHNLIVHLESGKDNFVPIRLEVLESSYGRPLENLEWILIGEEESSKVFSEYEFKRQLPRLGQENSDLMPLCPIPEMLYSLEEAIVKGMAAEGQTMKIFLHLEPVELHTITYIRNSLDAKTFQLLQPPSPRYSSSNVKWLTALCEVLLSFLHYLPEPLFPFSQQEKCIECLKEGLLNSSIELLRFLHLILPTTGHLFFLLHLTWLIRQVLIYYAHLNYTNDFTDLIRLFTNAIFRCESNEAENRNGKDLDLALFLQLLVLNGHLGMGLERVLRLEETEK